MSDVKPYPLAVPLPARRDPASSPVHPFPNKKYLAFHDGLFCWHSSRINQLNHPQTIEQTGDQIDIQ